MNSKKPLALACAIAFAIPFAAHADEALRLPPSSSPVRASPAPNPWSRSAPPSSPGTRSASAGVNDVNAAIRKIGGVFGRQSLDSSPDFALDLRGFGTNGAQNMVIMVDGVRLNENELASSVLSTSRSTPSSASRSCAAAAACCTAKARPAA
jgi:iron complex outermembrane receptor protein